MDMADIRKKREERAVVLIEVAIILPLLIILTVALIDYGWLFLKAQDTTNAARQAARLAIRPDATTTEVRTQIDNLMADAGLGDSGYVVTFTPADIQTPMVNQSLTVEIEIPDVSKVALIDIGLLPLPQRIRASMTMAKEGP